MIAPPTVTKCPRCKGTSVSPLAREEDRQRFECNLCHENFVAPAEPMFNQNSDETSSERRFSFLPIAAPDASENPPGLVRATCGKCEKPYYNLGKRYEHHIATCEGKVKWKAPGSRRRRQNPGGELVQGAKQTYVMYLETLRTRKAILEAELRAVDGLLSEFDKVGAMGGLPPPLAEGA